MSYYRDIGNKYAQVPDLIIDFHGYTTFECQEAIDALIREGGYKHIRMIIGRGKRSANGPVLPDFIKLFNFAKYSFQPVQDPRRWGRLTRGFPEVGVVLLVKICSNCQL